MRSLKTSNKAGVGSAAKDVMSRRRPVHDHELFNALVAHLRTAESEIRIGSMFGSPAAFLGRRLAFCVFGSAVGAKVPERDAARLIIAGKARAFRPFGRPAMKEWIELQATAADASKLAPILSLALRYAKDCAP